MNKVLRYFLFLLAGLFFLLCCFAALGYYLYRHEKTEINLLSSYKDEYPYIIIPVEIEGEVLQFVWDTGMPESCIDYKIANRLGYQGSELGYREMMGVRSFVADTFAFDFLPVSLGSLYSRERFRLDGDRQYFPTKPDGSSLYDLAPFAGIIGQNIISKYYWLFNFKEKKVKISRAEIDLGDAGESVLKFDSKTSKWNWSVPHVNLRINDRDTFRFVFDTGYALVQPVSFSDKELAIKSRFVFSDGLFDYVKQNPIKGGKTIEMKLENFHVLSLDSFRIDEKTIGPIVTGSNLHHQKQYPRNYITVFFAYSFREMYYNPVKKEIDFYFSPQDSNFVYQGEEEKLFFDFFK